MYLLRKLPKLTYARFQIFIGVYLTVLFVTNWLVGERALLNIAYSQGRIPYYFDWVLGIIFAPLVEEVIFRGWLLKKNKFLKQGSFGVFLLIVVNQITKYWFNGGFIFEYIQRPLLIDGGRFAIWIRLFGTPDVLGQIVSVGNSVLYILIFAGLYCLLRYIDVDTFNFQKHLEARVLVSVLFFILWHQNDLYIWEDPIILYAVFGIWYSVLAIRYNLIVAMLGHSFYNATINLSYVWSILLTSKNYIDLLVAVLIWMFLGVIFFKSIRKKTELMT